MSSDRRRCDDDKNKQPRYRLVRIIEPGKPPRLVRREVIPPPRLAWVNPNEPWVTTPFRPGRAPDAA